MAIAHKNKDGIWFDPEDEWFADEGPAEYEVLAVDVECIEQGDTK